MLPRERLGRFILANMAAPVFQCLGNERCSYGICVPPDFVASCSDVALAVTLPYCTCITRAPNPARQARRPSSAC